MHVLRCFIGCAVVLIGSADTARAQSNTLITSPSPLVFCAEPGQGLSTVPVSISTSSGTILFNDTAISSDGNWLSANPSVGTIETTPHGVFLLGVDGNVVTLPTGTYNGQITLKQNGAVVGRLDPTLNVSPTACGSAGVNIVASTPGSLAFQLPPGVSSFSQTVNLTNTFPIQVTIVLGASTATGQKWLAVTDNTNLFLASHTTTPILVTVNTTGLDPGTYRGNVEIDGSSNVQLNIPVTLIVKPQSATIVPVASPNPVAINLPFGTATTRQNIQLTNPSSSPINITTDISFIAGRNWMSVSPAAELVPANSTVVLAVTINAGNLTPGQNIGNIFVDVTSGGGARLTLPVSVNYGTSVGLSSLSVLPAQLSFAFQTGATAPPPQTLSVSSSAPANFVTQATTTSGGNWLAVNAASGTTPATLSVTANPNVLPSGTYRGQVVITNAINGQQQLIPVSLLVSALPVLSIGNNGTTFFAQAGSPVVPAPQSVTVASSGLPLTFSASASPVADSDFLSVAPAGGTTPQTLTFSLNANAISQLAPGSHSANVLVTAASAGNILTVYPVTLNVTNDTLLNPSLTALSFSYQPGQPPPAARIIGVSSTGFPLKYAVSTTATKCAGFFSATASSDTTPAVVAVTINPASLPAGTCRGTVNLTSATAGNSPLQIPVSLEIANSPLLTVQPGAINVTVKAGTNPPAQAIRLTSTDGTTPLNFTVTPATDTSKGWLVTDAAGGSTPQDLTVSFKTADLPIGVYAGRITIASSALPGGPLTVPVTVTVTSAATAATAPAFLAFAQVSQGAPPAAQSIQLTATIPNILFSTSAATFSGGNWLSASSVSVSTPATVSVRANGASLNPGVYNGFVTITVPGMANSPLVVPVTLSVSAPEPVTAVLNAASLQSGPIAPGEMITIFGTNLGPPEGLLFTLTAAGTVPLTLANTTVSFDGHPAPLIFVRADQINAIVPYEIAGSTSANLVVRRNGIDSAPRALKVVDTSPAIYSFDQSGSGQGAILNANNSVNTIDNPAARGSVIQIFATGEGLCAGAATGSVTPASPPFLTPAAAVSVTIGGKAAQTQFVGEAPGAVSGLLQVNAVVPDSIGSGPQPVVLKIGSSTNDTQNITVAVQ